MTYVDTRNFPREPLTSGRAYDIINQTFSWLGQVGGAANIETQSERTSAQRDPLEERLRLIQDTVSEVSMHLPIGFASGLNRQFANLMDDDAWEDDDVIISLTALNTFVRMLLCTNAKRRPGIGTNGNGSITASWTEGNNRLIIECLPDERVSVILSRQNSCDETERAAFGPMRVERVNEILKPYKPEVWFDG